MDGSIVLCLEDSLLEAGDFFWDAIRGAPCLCIQIPLEHINSRQLGRACRWSKLGTWPAVDNYPRYCRAEWLFCEPQPGLACASDWNTRVQSIQPLSRRFRKLAERIWQASMFCFIYDFSPQICLMYVRSFLNSEQMVRFFYCRWSSGETVKSTTGIGMMQNESESCSDDVIAHISWNSWSFI